MAVGTEVSIKPKPKDSHLSVESEYENTENVIKATVMVEYAAKYYADSCCAFFTHCLMLCIFFFWTAAFLHQYPLFILLKCRFELISPCSHPQSIIYV